MIIMMKDMMKITVTAVVSEGTPSSDALACMLYRLTDS